MMSRSNLAALVVLAAMGAATVIAAHGLGLPSWVTAALIVAFAGLLIGVALSPPKEGSD